MTIWTGENMKKYLLLLICVVFLFESCSTKVITRKYYLLEFSDQQDISIQTESIVSDGCEIVPTSVPPAFGQSRIAVRKRSHEISYYHNYQWAVAPGDMIAKLVEEYTRDTNIFRKTSQAVWSILPRYQLYSQVLQIEAEELDDELMAHLHMQLDLYDRVEKRIIVSHSFNRIEMLEERDINLLAKKLSRIIKEELKNFSAKIKTGFSNK